MSPDPSGPRRLVLLRHGRTEWNHVRRAQGHAPVPLDEVGHQQAKRAAVLLAELQPSRLWSSDLERAAQTARHVADVVGLEVELDPRLREYDVGVRSGLTTAEFEERHPREYAAWLAHDESLLVEGEESSTLVRERVLPALADCLEALRAGETGIVVMHGACLRVGLLAVLGWPPETSRGLRGMDNCGWTVLGDHEIFGGLRMVSYNETASVGQHPDRAAGGDFASDEAVG